METMLDDTKIKELFKQALIEAIEEKRDVVHDLFMDAMEDIAMVRAIEEGETTDQVSREEVFNVFK